MKKIVSFLLIAVISLGFVNVNVSAAESDSGKPLIGIAWRADVDSEFYTNITTALDQIGADYVLIPQVKSDDLKYDDNGKLTNGVAKTGALTKAAGKLVRTNTWHGSNVESAMADIDAVICTGGEDISPSLYYKQVKWHGIEEERDYNAERDVSDYLLMAYCLDNDIPMIGFCRGMQMLGVISGGTVIQDIPTYFASLGLEYNYEHRNQKDAPDSYRDYSAHDVKIAKNSILYDIVGNTKITGCPSWHHQAVKSVKGTRLKVTGTITISGIKMIEAFERTDKSFAVGLQFHPEAAVAKNVNNAENSDKFMSMDKALNFFEYFVQYASDYKNSKSVPEDYSAKALNDMDIQYVMYLGTNDKDTNEPVFSHEDAKAKVKEVLLKNFGGYTIMEADGGWIDGDTEYQEYTLVIYLSDTSLDDVHKAADELIKEFNQSSVMIQANPTKTEFYSR